MKAITNIQLITQKLAARLYTAAPTRADKQRGASALEYIMLAAVIVGLLVAVAVAYSEDGNNPIKTFFDDLFSKASSPAGSP